MSVGDGIGELGPQGYGFITHLVHSEVRHNGRQGITMTYFGETAHVHREFKHDLFAAVLFSVKDESKQDRFKVATRIDGQSHLTDYAGDASQARREFYAAVDMYLDSRLFAAEAESEAVTALRP